MIKTRRAPKMSEKRTKYEYIDENTRNENYPQDNNQLKNELENQETRFPMVEQEMTVVFDCKYTPKTLQFRENES